VRHPCRLWTRDKIKAVMCTCIILHNMILEDDGRATCQNYQPRDIVALPQATREQRAANVTYVRSKDAHNALMSNLIE
jgi:ferredoxin-thioredoxin reductase catalytic subunit